MTQEDRVLIRGVLHTTVRLVAFIVACHFLKPIAILGLILFGLQAASSRQLDKSLIAYVLFPLIIVSNPYLASVGGLGGFLLRIGFILMTLMLVMTAGARRGEERVPLGFLWFYLILAAATCFGGYAPFISLLKLFNFAMFLIGLSIGLANLHNRPRSLMRFRHFLLALSVYIVFGSLALLPFPGISCFASLQGLINEVGVAAANEYAHFYNSHPLFCGVTNQSQCLAPLSVLVMGWVTCDMVFIEKRKSMLHLAIMAASIPVMYMTRSRTALFAMVVVVGFIQVYCFRYLFARPRVQKILKRGFTAIVFLAIVGALVMEVRDRSISRWMRKTEDVSGDDRSLTEALTESRSGLNARNLRDFRRNPLFGSGFQVDESFPYRYGNRFVISAPIEKGVLPTMILGETGICGAIVFLVFVLAFYSTCTQRRYIVTATLFTGLLATNMGEATFFSTGGSGGILWIFTFVGGFTIDMIVHNQRRAAGWSPQSGILNGV